MRLDWSAIDLDEGILTIGSQIAKKHRLRVLELMPSCIACSRRSRIARGALARYSVRWAQFVKKAGVGDWGENRCNVMQHSFGS